jgi:hypothetical protein
LDTPSDGVSAPRAGVIVKRPHSTFKQPSSGRPKVSERTGRRLTTRIEVSRSCDQGRVQTVIPVTAKSLPPPNLPRSRWGGCARAGMHPWTRPISGIKPKPVCGWRKGYRGTIRHEANLWSLPKSSNAKPKNSPPAQNERRSCGTPPKLRMTPACALFVSSTAAES